jgi:two-component system sensor histidine kinase YesM
MKLVLQPFVENAIEHGILEKINGGTVSLNGHIDGDYMVFSVVDNGKGMSVDKLNEILKIVNSKQIEDNTSNRTNFGMYNVITRLKLMYQQDFEFKCHSEEGKGTEIILKIPIQGSADRWEVKCD